MNPRATLFPLLVNPTNPIHIATTKDLQAAADARGLRLHVLNASREADFDVVFVKLEELRASLVMTNEIGLPNSLEQVGF